MCFLKIVGKDGVRVVVGFLNGKSPGKPPFFTVVEQDSLVSFRRQKRRNEVRMRRDKVSLIIKSS